MTILSRIALDPTFLGFGRASTDVDGHYWFQTVKPGAVPVDDGDAMQAPHIVILAHPSGVMFPLVTRMYFADDPGNETDPLLQRIPALRRPTLLANREERDGETVYRFDIVLQGESEELVLESTFGGEPTANAPSGAGRAETVFLALR